MARLSGLGKGLGALIPADAAAVVSGDQPRLEELPIGSIVPNPHQPRVHFDEESLAGIATPRAHRRSPPPFLRLPQKGRLLQIPDSY